MINELNSKQKIDKILKDIYAVLREDKSRMIKFCLERGHTQVDIATALGIKQSTLSQYIKRNKLGSKIKITIIN